MVRKPRFRIATVVLLACGALQAGTLPAADAPPPAAPALEKARALFKAYADEEGRFDPAVADLYADDAVIRNKRTYPDGQVREMTLPAPKYKELIRAAMPLARERGDTSRYSNSAGTPRKASGSGSRARGFPTSRNTNRRCRCWSVPGRRDAG